MESDGKRTGVCSVCGDSVHITPPSSFNVKWNNESHTERGYSETLPMDLKSGSKYTAGLKVFWMTALIMM